MKPSDFYLIHAIAIIAFAYLYFFAIAGERHAPRYSTPSQEAQVHTQND